MSKTEDVIISLREAASRVQDIIPEGHYHYRHYDFIQALLNSVNRDLEHGIEQSDRVITYLENIIIQANDAVNNYELLEFFQSPEHTEFMKVIVASVVTPLRVLQSNSSYYPETDDDLSTVGSVDFEAVSQT